MPLRDDPPVTIIIADYIGVDAVGKLNIIGGGWMLTGLQSNGLTGRQYVAVLVDIRSGHIGEEFARVLELFELTTGGIAQVVGPTGSPEALRISQLAKVDPLIGLPGTYV